MASSPTPFGARRAAAHISAHTAHTTPVAPRVVRCRHRRVEPDRHLFSHDPDGTAPWRPDYATLAFARLANQLGMTKIRLHDLRHFAATTMLLNGIDVRTAAGRLGHARASTTLDTYAHYTQPADHRASATLANSLDASR